MIAAALLCAVPLAGPASAAGLEPTYGEAPVIAPATAAVPVAPVAPWTGPFAGASLGFSSFDGEAERGTAIGAIIVTDIENGLFPSGIDERDVAAAGGIAVGYDYQRGGFVVGIELGIWGMNQDADLSFSAIDPEILVGAETTTTYGTEIDRMTMLRLRAGMARGRNLYYATAGLAAAEVENSFGLAIDTIGFDRSFSDEGHRRGYIVGAGVERLVAERITLKAELSYYDLEDVTIEARDADVFPGQAIGYEFRNDGMIAAIGVNYRF